MKALRFTIRHFGLTGLELGGVAGVANTEPAVAYILGRTVPAAVQIIWIGRGPTATGYASLRRLGSSICLAILHQV